MIEPHAAQHVIGLGELDVGIADDLDQIAPRIAEVEERAGLDGYAGFDQAPARRFLVLDDQAEVTAAGRWRPK